MGGRSRIRCTPFHGAPPRHVRHGPCTGGVAWFPQKPHDGTTSSSSSSYCAAGNAGANPFCLRQSAGPGQTDVYRDRRPRADQRGGYRLEESPRAYADARRIRGARKRHAAATFSISASTTRRRSRSRSSSTPAAAWQWGRASPTPSRSCTTCSSGSIRRPTKSRCSHFRSSFTRTCRSRRTARRSAARCPAWSRSVDVAVRRHRRGRDGARAAGPRSRQGLWS